MKPEQKQLVRFIEPIFVCVVFGALYSVAGSGDFWNGKKWIRRFLAPFLFCVWAFIRSGFDWRYLAQMPLMMGALCLPYGADTTIVKVMLRGVFGLANGLASTTRNLLRRMVAISITHIVVCVAVSVGIGVWNQTNDAMAEQFLIGLTCVILPAFSVKVKSND